MAFAACGGGSSTTATAPSLPNIAQIESAIAGTIKADDHVTAQVLCPSSVPEVVGETFSCIGIARQPRVETFMFLVTAHGGTYVTYARTA